MKKTFPALIFALAASLLLSGGLAAQTVFPGYNYRFYEKLNSAVYSPGSKIHSSLKPFLPSDSLLEVACDSVFNAGNTSGKGGTAQKLLTAHLIEKNSENAFWYADILPKLTAGHESGGNNDTYMMSAGYQAGGVIAKKLSFQTSGFFSRAKFPAYYTNYMQAHGVIPGQRHQVTTTGGVAEDVQNWNYFTGSISYTPVKYFNIEAGYDKNFIGDGYRSLLLSDFASPYPFAKLTATIGDVRYMAMWAAMTDPSAPRFDNSARGKGAVFHYLDWNVSRKLSVGFFDAIVWASADSLGNRRGFNWGYANPFIFLRPVESDGGSPDNAVMGFTAKYELTGNMAVYGQFALDEFEAKNFFTSNGSSRNKWGFQLGVRGDGLLKIPSLNYLLEYNTVRPYTFSERVSVVNYAHYNEPIGHPFGANFRELLGTLSYSYKRFNISTELLYSRYGLDKDGLNYGKDIFKLYTQPAKDKGNRIGQGLSTDLWFTDTRIAWIINAKSNLRLEAGLVSRNEKNDENSNNTAWITFGLRSSFRNLYHDF